MRQARLVYAPLVALDRTTSLAHLITWTSTSLPQTASAWAVLTIFKIRDAFTIMTAASPALHFFAGGAEGVDNVGIGVLGHAQRGRTPPGYGAEVRQECHLEQSCI